MTSLTKNRGVGGAGADSGCHSLGIYIQVPFCQTKCTYCNFHTGVASPSAYAPYARAVEHEITNWRSLHAAAGLSSAALFDSVEQPITGVVEPEKDVPITPLFGPQKVGEASAFAEVTEQPSIGVVERQKGLVIRPLLPPENVTIYFGGGTPSLFDPAALARILAAVRSQFAPASDCHPFPTFSHRPAVAGVIPNPAALCADVGEESAFSASVVQPTSEIVERQKRVPNHAAFGDKEVTLEADPETITPERAAAWLATGINRISLGTQSFHDAELKAAGRMHRRADIFSGIAFLRSAGFTNISLDLIAGLPYQTPASWRESLDETLALRPQHISIYLFEIDEASRLGRELLAGGARYSAAAVPSDDAMADSYEFACERLRQAGYDHYEISNWALPGFRSRHNLKYWRREPYLGFGAGAHSFDGRFRWANAHDPAAYVAAIENGRLPVEQLEEVTPKQALDEELFLGLRQLDGIDLAPIAAQYGARQQAQYNALGKRIDELRAQGLVECEGTRVRLAPARLAVSNEVFVALLDER